MSGDFETLEINQPKITYLKPEDNTKWLDKLMNNIEEMKNNIKTKREFLFLLQKSLLITSILKCLLLKLKMN